MQRGSVLGISFTVTTRERKSPFVRLFTKTPAGVICPHFYELILSNGCPYDCAYCYLRLTFRGKKDPVLYTNRWEKVEDEIRMAGPGVFSTGELADSLAVLPPLLPRAIEYFRTQKDKYLLLTTKSCNTKLFEELSPTRQVIISFSINAPEVASKYERLAPSPFDRLNAATRLLELGWRVRVRIDPVIIEGVQHDNISIYRKICKIVGQLGVERVTVGTLRQYPGLHRFAPSAPRGGLVKAPDGRMRYSLSVRVRTYNMIAEWLGFEPALCKETYEVWEMLTWRYRGCNCTV
ncbi:spore photoproduct lyase [Thermanaeromonas toyohensis ToBE]|uniref:Spore photoproduct lyase n=1 Tax=Thermanaeromonas toyohensis ToBE TaxID=698762 RepID=A0A1W1VST0_9FIRM|nr:spore photoproduct lyase [Thermanaeromonas toyohensis ToBE]